MDDETVAAALAVLGDVALWRFAPEHWERVGEIFDRMAAAYRCGDRRALHDATNRLQLSGPLRVSRIGATHARAIPPRVLVRRDSLTRVLRGAAARPGDGGGCDGPEAGGARQPPA